MSVGTYENPRIVTQQEGNEIRAKNVEGLLQADIISRLGELMDLGLTDEEILIHFQEAVKGACSWLSN